MSASLTKVVDLTWPVRINIGKILGGRGRLEVDPWSFVFPLTPLVWVATLSSLLVLTSAVFLFSTCLHLKTSSERWQDTFNFISLFLQQGFVVQHKWWWERVMLAVWGLVVVVLTQSYAGNLMALLAVAHVNNPIQSLHDVLNDGSATLIAKKVTEHELGFLVISELLLLYQ
nr:glutamate receptor 3.2-like [Procambarus clarkii]